MTVRLSDSTELAEVSRRSRNWASSSASSADSQQAADRRDAGKHPRLAANPRCFAPEQRDRHARISQAVCCVRIPRQVTCRSRRRRSLDCDRHVGASGQCAGGHAQGCAGVPVTSGRQIGNLLLVPSDGNRVDDQGFSAYGNLRRDGIGVERSFTSQQKDFSSGLLYMHPLYYDRSAELTSKPQMGQFISQKHGFTESCGCLPAPRRSATFCESALLRTRTT